MLARQVVIVPFRELGFFGQPAGGRTRRHCGQGYSRRMSGSTSIVGRWRITEMDNWDQEAVDLVQPGFIEFDDDGLGELGFIVVTGELDCRDAYRDGRPGVEFSWQGSDEGDDVCGRGWAALSPDGALEGHIYFHLGDDSAFRAERFNEIIQLPFP